MGVWLETGLGVELRTEGIGRVLAALVGALAAAPDTRVIVALGKWSEKPFRALLADWHIPPASVEVLASRDRFFLDSVRERAQAMLPAPNWSGRGRIRRAIEPLRDAVRRVRYGTRRVMSALEFSGLARSANRRGVDVWFVPHPTAHRARALTAPIVVAVPDLVYVHMPEVFPPSLTSDIDLRVRRLVPRAAAVISYSRFVADRHVSAYLGVDPSRVHVVPHGSFDAAARLAARPGDGPGRRARAAQLVRDFLGSQAPVRFEEIEYLFVTTQVRPYKNYLNLFSAFARLRSRRSAPLKLVFTGSLDALLEGVPVREHLVRAGLEADVISMSSLPSDVHAAFFQLAVLTVVPTLFEGGFPFPFYESLSVDTPVVISAIPVTLEIVPQDLQPVMLFPPNDVAAMAGRIEWALGHRSELLRRQQALFVELRRRTWADAAKDYVAILKGAAGGRARR